MPNYFKHHENGDVKQISIHTYEINGNGIVPFPDNYILIWGEDANGTTTFDKNGNKVSDNSYDYIYDDAGKLISTKFKNAEPGVINTLDVTYNSLDEIAHWGDMEFHYNDNNQINRITEIYEPHGYFPGSHREYEYNDDGQMKSCNFNYNKSIYGCEYNDNGELIHYIQLMEHGKVQEYYIEITNRDEKGNWIERHIKGTNYNGLPEEYLQKREIRYY